jgi:putative protease
VELHEAANEQFETVRLLKSAGKVIYFALPAIIRDKDRKGLKKHMMAAKALADGWLVRQMEGFLLVTSLFPEDRCVFDSSIYAMNRRAKAFLKNLGQVQLSAPAELNYQELKSLGCRDMELLVYGHQQLMISAQCVKKTREGCTKRPELMVLTDRQHKQFYVYNECEFCYNKIYNGLATMLIDKKKELLTLCPEAFRIHFTMETEAQMKALLKNFDEVYVQGTAEKNILENFTRGHFTRGIE